MKFHISKENLDLVVKKIAECICFVEKNTKEEIDFYNLVDRFKDASNPIIKEESEEGRFTLNFEYTPIGYLRFEFSSTHAEVVIKTTKETNIFEIEVFVAYQEGRMLNLLSDLYKIDNKILEEAVKTFGEDLSSIHKNQKELPKELTDLAETCLRIYANNPKIRRILD